MIGVCVLRASDPSGWYCERWYNRHSPSRGSAGHPSVNERRPERILYQHYQDNKVAEVAQGGHHREWGESRC